MAYNSNYVLLASGHIGTPVLTISVDHETRITNVIYAEKVVAQLSKAGYFNFTLYDVSEEIHTTIATFNVEQVDPIVNTFLKSVEK